LSLKKQTQVKPAYTSFIQSYTGSCVLHWLGF